MKSLSTYFKCVAIRNSLLVRASRVLTNTVTDNEKDGLIGIFDRIPEWEKEYGSFKIDPNDMTVEEMDDLGFVTPIGKYGIYSSGDFCAIPIWLYPFLADEFVYSTNLAYPRLNKKSNMDISYENQIDYAILNYCIIPKELKTKINL